MKKTLSINNNKTIGQLTQEAYKALTPYLSPRSFRKGQLIWSEGDTDGLLVHLKSGRVKIYRLLPTGRAVTLFIFGAGTLFGFMPFLDGRPYPAYAQALEDCETEIMHRSELAQVLQKDPEVAVALIKELSNRLRDAFDTIERLSSRGANPKVAAAIYGLAVEGVNPNNLTIVTLPVASHEFAQSLGLTPESFSRGVAELIRQGILKRLKKNRFQVLDISRLQEAAGEIIW